MLPASEPALILFTIGQTLVGGLAATLWVLFSIFGVLMGLGFVIGIAGHIFKARVLIATGVLLVFAATGLFLVAVAQHG